MKPVIMLSSGQYFDFEHPENSVFGIEEIAHALSHICRFTGHSRKFYSVAQHCVLASQIVPPQHALAALLHDAPEAFIGDVSSPLKAMLPDYRLIEHRVETEVLRRFGLPPGLPPEVKQADLVMLATERKALLPPRDDDVWSILEGVEPLATPLIPWSANVARVAFLARFHVLRWDAPDWEEST